MSIQIDVLEASREESYKQLLLTSDTALLYVSISYRNFLQRILKNSNPYYLLAYHDGHLVGALPTFIMTHQTYGSVLNSLPFYGSNGGLIVSPQCGTPIAVKQALLDAFRDLAIQQHVAISTLITNPLDSTDTRQIDVPHTWRDVRIGQITSLPDTRDGDDDLEDRLMSSFHKKTRNSIRKASKSDVLVSSSASFDVLRNLAEIHKENIEAIGGLAKPWPVFEAIWDCFEYDRDYKIYTAERRGKLIAALLVFFYNRTAEYFVPGTLADARIYQPMSLLIFEAMKDATKRSLYYWNWGGTWLNQDGVYDFKKRWGTYDKMYYYYVQEYAENSRMRDLTAQELQKAYPYFYVLPYSALDGEVN